VLEKETKVSKGVGYVTFAMKEDAAACVEKGKVEMNGRNLRVSWAGAKVRLILQLFLLYSGLSISSPSPERHRRSRQKNHLNNSISRLDLNLRKRTWRQCAP
jgi:RNA recognition motif-containing protein